ncbi:hypothetical protein BJY01DRAFT_201498 [Aspergillus pseudoustus]|uniref:Uncharacterized protein n=1 Tax=Aspergillus pseudoustus TaxID=1810923 RepID=A0ABR4L087_9EURO
MITDPLTAVSVCQWIGQLVSTTNPRGWLQRSLTSFTILRAAFVEGFFCSVYLSIFWKEGPRPVCFFGSPA